MKKFECLFGRNDKLHWFAESALAGRMLFPAEPLSTAEYDGVTAHVLYRNGEFQAELIVCAPNVVLPDHAHPRADSIEVFYQGSLRFNVGGRDVLPGMDDRRFARVIKGRGVRIDAGVRHSVRVGSEGAVFHSFQRWRGCEPRPIGDDWDGEPVSRAHLERLDAAAKG